MRWARFTTWTYSGLRLCVHEVSYLWKNAIAGACRLRNNAPSASICIERSLLAEIRYCGNGGTVWFLAKGCDRRLRKSSRYGPGPRIQTLSRPEELLNEASEFMTR